MLSLDALIDIETISVLITVIIMGFCIVFESRRSKRLPVEIVFVSILVSELFFFIFSLLQHLAQRSMLTKHLIVFEREYYVFRGLSNISLFVLLVAYVICVVTYLADDSKPVKLFMVTSIIACCLAAALFLFSIMIPEVNDILYSCDFFGRQTANVFYLMSAVVFLIAAFMIFLFVKYFNRIRKPILFAVLSFVLCPAVVLFLHFWGFDYNLIYPAMIVSFIFMFCFAYMWQVEKKREQQIIISNTRLFMLQNQIRPHFLYNTLNSIYILCEKDPAAAQLAISNFSEYMRANLDCLEGVSLITLDKELENVEHYLELEKMRYGDSLEIEYDIDIVDVMIPPMTIQILAENAVKHGIERKSDGVGKIVIRTRRMAKSDLIIVEDNGVGFDVETLNSGTGSHIGINNVRERLKQLLNATLIIESERGKSTVATISIPKCRTSSVLNKNIYS